MRLVLTECTASFFVWLGLTLFLSCFLSQVLAESWEHSRVPSYLEKVALRSAPIDVCFEDSLLPPLLLLLERAGWVDWYIRHVRLWRGGGGAPVAAQLQQQRRCLVNTGRRIFVAYCLKWLALGVSFGLTCPRSTHQALECTLYHTLESTMWGM